MCIFYIYVKLVRPTNRNISMRCKHFLMRFQSKRLIKICALRQNPSELSGIMRYINLNKSVLFLISLTKPQENAKGGLSFMSQHRTFLMLIFDLKNVTWNKHSS